MIIDYLVWGALIWGISGLLNYIWFKKKPIPKFAALLLTIPIFFVSLFFLSIFKVMRYQETLGFTPRAFLDVVGPILFSWIFYSVLIKKNKQDKNIDLVAPKNTGNLTSDVKDETPASTLTEGSFDDQYYEIAWSEIEGGKTKKSLWAKAFSESDGDKNRTRAKYVTLRVKDLYSENEVEPANFKEAAKRFQKPTEQKDADARYMLGLKYSISEGVVEDEEEAAKWYRKAAEKGDADAQNVLGYMYSIGKGVAEDEEKAVKWYQKAAEQGHAGAQFNLGKLYGDDILGVGKDYVMSYMFYNIAGTNGERFAPKERDIVAEKMTSSQVQEAQKLAREWIAERE